MSLLAVAHAAAVITLRVLLAFGSVMSPLSPSQLRHVVIAALCAAFELAGRMLMAAQVALPRAHAVMSGIPGLRAPKAKDLEALWQKYEAEAKAAKAAAAKAAAPRVAKAAAARNMAANASAPADADVSGSRGSADQEAIPGPRCGHLH